MKKLIQQIFILGVMIGLLSCSMQVFAEEDRQLGIGTKEIGAYELEQYDTTILLEDVSFSMRSTFANGVKKIAIDRENFSIYRTFEASDGKTNLWGELNRAFEEGNSVSIITDLWDTTQEELLDYHGKDLRIYVPFNSDDNEAVKHVENIVFNYIQPHFSDSFVKVIYLDGEEDILIQSETAILIDENRKRQEAEAEVKAESESNTEIIDETVNKVESEDEHPSIVEPEISTKSTKNIAEPVTTKYNFKQFFTENWKKIIVIFLIILLILIIITKCRKIFWKLLESFFNGLESATKSVLISIRNFFKKPFVKKILAFTVTITMLVLIVIFCIKNPTLVKEIIDSDITIYIISFILLIVVAVIFLTLKYYLELHWHTNKVASILLTILVAIVFTAIAVFFWMSEPSMRLLLCLLAILVTAFVYYIMLSIASIIALYIFDKTDSLKEYVSDKKDSLKEYVSDIKESIKEHKKIMEELKNCQIIIYGTPLKDLSYLIFKKVQKELDKKTSLELCAMKTGFEMALGHEITDLKALTMLLQKMAKKRYKRIVLILSEDLTTQFTISNGYHYIEKIVVISPPNNVFFYD